jgi:hypothetical protein
MQVLIRVEQNPVWQMPRPIFLEYHYSRFFFFAKLMSVARLMGVQKLMAAKTDGVTRVTPPCDLHHLKSPWRCLT